MHEIRVTVPSECAAETARLAHDVGIERVADVYIHGPDLRRQVVSIEASTPKPGFLSSLPGFASTG